MVVLNLLHQVGVITVKHMGVIAMIGRAKRTRRELQACMKVSGETVESVVKHLVNRSIVRRLEHTGRTFTASERWRRVDQFELTEQGVQALERLELMGKLKSVCVKQKQK